jgi:hypothetical protein
VEEHRLRVFENRVIKRIFGLKRKLHNEELHVFYSSPNIIRQITSRRMRWPGHGREEKHTRFWWESPKERDLLKD